MSFRYDRYFDNEANTVELFNNRKFTSTGSLHQQEVLKNRKYVTGPTIDIIHKASLWQMGLSTINV